MKNVFHPKRNGEFYFCSFFKNPKVNPPNPWIKFNPKVNPRISLILFVNTNLNPNPNFGRR